jgi:hypothetical protein
MPLRRRIVQPRRRRDTACSEGKMREMPQIQRNPFIAHTVEV